MTLTDGSAVTFTAGPWEYSQWEQYAARKGLPADSTPMTFTMYLAYCAIHRANWPQVEGFEQWSQKIADVQMEDPTEARPTEAAPSAAPSP